MTSRHRITSLLLLGLSLGLGCGVGPARFHQGRANQVCRKDAAVAVDGFTPLNSLDSGQPWDSGLDPASDSRPTAVGDIDAEESVDACDDGQSVEVGRACGRSPWVLVGQVPNVRQLGGLPLARGGTVACDLVYRGSSLSSLTQEGCGQFAATGIKTVVDIRSESEQTSPPAACVAQYAGLVSAPLPTPYNVSPADYLADLYTAPSMQKLFRVLADPASYPVYYHCLYGKDRTGIVTAVILSALGVSRQTIQDEYAMSGEAGFAYYPASLDAVLDELERLGGVDNYFRVVGIPTEHVQAMRTILLGSL